MSIFAVKYPGQDWRIARKITAGQFAALRGLIADNPDWEVWCDRGSRAWVGYVGNGEVVVELPDNGEGQADG